MYEEIMRYIQNEEFFFNGQIPDILTTDVLNLPVNMEILSSLPFKKMLEARRKLFASDSYIRNMICDGHNEELTQLWLDDIEDDSPIITPIRPDYVIDGNGKVQAAEFDLLPGGAGFTAGMERKIMDNSRRTLDIYVQFLKQVGMTEDSVLVMVVPDEKDPYLYERLYVGREIRKNYGLKAYGCSLEDIDWNTMTIKDENGEALPITHVDRLYYYHEIPNSISAEAKEKITHLKDYGVIEFPAIRREYLHAKVWEAFFWMPQYEEYWIEELGEDVFRQFQKLTPKTWLLSEKADELYSSMKSERNHLLLKEGAAERPNCWGSRSVTVLGKVTNTKMQQMIDSIKNGDESFKMRGGLPLIPLIQEVIVSDTFSVNTNQGEFKGKIRFSPFIWIDGNGFAGFSPGLSTLRNSMLVHGASDSCSVVNV